MKKIFLSFCLCCIVNSIFAQEFIQLLSEQTYSFSKNIKTTVLDNRPETADCGFIQTGAFNKYTPVSFEHGLKNDIENFLNKRCKSQNSNDSSFTEMLVRVDFFRISEQTNHFSEKGYFKFVADYFLKENDKYFFLGSVDTLAVVSAMDVTKKNLKNVGEVMMNLQHSFSNGKHLTQEYSPADIVHFDDILKKSIPIYSATKINDGFYNSWKALAENHPTSKPSVAFVPKKNRFYYLKKNGKIDFRVEPEDSIFALCDSGKLYISNGEEFYHATFENNDFFITAKGNKRIDQAEAMGVQIMFGLIGRAIYESSQPNIFYLYKVNFKNGYLMPVKEIEIKKEE